MRSTSFSPPPTPSALTTFLSTHSSSSSQPAPNTALPLEILHNLRHQHFWSDLRLQHHQKRTPSLSLSLSPSPSLSYPNSNPDPAPKSDLENPQKDTNTPSSSTLPPPPAAAAPPETSCNEAPQGKAQPSITRSTPSVAPVVLLSGTPPRPLYTHPDLQRKLLKAGIAEEADLEVEREWVVPTTVARKWTFGELCAVFDSLPRRPTRRWYRKEDGRVEERRRRRRRRRRRKEAEEEEEEEEKKKKGGECAGAGAGKRPSTDTDTDIDIDMDADTETETEAEAEAEVMVEHQDVKRVLLAMKAHEGLGGDGTVVYYIVQEGEVKPRQN